jgi:hypothetical protein
VIMKKFILRVWPIYMFSAPLNMKKSFENAVSLYVSMYVCHGSTCMVDQILFILSCVRVTLNGLWIGNFIY